MPFHLIRLAYNTTYAFSPIPSLNPVSGTFATKLILIFGTQLGATLAMVAGGWLGTRSTSKEALGEIELAGLDSTDRTFPNWNEPSQQRESGNRLAPKF
jgi:hypothetical protein